MWKSHANDLTSLGFGNASTLGMQRLNNSVEGYFASQGSVQRTPAQQPAEPRRPMPKFDMNLKDLFSEEEIASRPLTHQPKIQLQNPHHMRPPVTEPPPAPTMSPHTPASNTSPQSTEGAYPHVHRTPSMSYQTTNQTPYAPFADTISQAHPDFSFENLDFLNDFPVADPNAGGFWAQHNNASTGAGANDFSFDLGFGNGGYDGSGAWEANGELFDTFFFGSGGGGGGGGGNGGGNGYS